MSKNTRSSSLRTFVIIWLGQLVSTIGSGLTGFALGVWIYQETGSTMLFTLNMLAFALPTLIMSNNLATQSTCGYPGSSLFRAPDDRMVNDTSRLYHRWCFK